MGHYDKSIHKSKPRPQMNPMWRGIGCIFFIVAPLISYAIAVLLVPPLDATGMVPLELLGHIHFADWVYHVPILNSIAGFIAGINDMGLGLIVWFVVLVLLTGVFTLIYVAIMQTIGPPRYSEIDAPPPRYKAKPYKR
jgi:hypothetical protein